MTEPVKRYDPNYSAISPADDLAVEADDGMFVMHDDYARLEQECERLRLDAERYRLYRQGMENPEAFDAGVDAALSAKP